MIRSKRVLRTILTLLFSAMLMFSMGNTVWAANETVAVVSGIPAVKANTGSTSSNYNSYWQYWSQGASRYSCMRSAGCRVVAYAKLLAEIGCGPSNPDDLFSWMGQKGYINTSSCLELGNFGVTPVKYAQERGISLTLAATPQISGSNANNAAAVMSYINQGYYVIVMCGNHTAYIGRNASLANNVGIILDSWSSWSSSPYTAIKYGTYNYQTFTRILAFKLGTPPGPPVSVTTADAANISERNAKVTGSVTKSSSIRSGMRVGIYFGENASSMSKVISEEPSAGAYSINSGTGFNMWYDLNSECGITLKHARTYYWKCYATYEGKEYVGAVKSFTTPGSHSWGSGTVTTAPTCTSTGIRTYTCSCGDRKTETIPKTGHTEDGGTVTTPATCTKAGTRTYKCTRCGAQLRTEAIPKTAHAEDGGTITTPATCTKAGIMTIKCINCGNEVRSVSIVPTGIHTFGEWITVRPASETEEGFEKHSCIHCAEEEYRSIPAKGETPQPSDADSSQPVHDPEPTPDHSSGESSAESQSTEKATPEPSGEDSSHAIHNPEQAPDHTSGKPSTGKPSTANPPADKTIHRSTSGANEVAYGNTGQVMAEVKALPENGEIKNASFFPLQARMQKAAKSSITIAWKQLPGAGGYTIYGNKCGQRYKKIAEVRNNSWTHKKLKKGTYYKYLIVAHDASGKVLASSKTVHAATSGGKKGNPKTVKINKKSVSLNVGKTFTLKATVKNGTKKVNTHRTVAYESSNPQVAAVNEKGKIKAVSAGTCYVYAYAQNGVSAKIKVTIR